MGVKSDEEELWLNWERHRFLEDRTEIDLVAETAENFFEEN